jgi:subtilisin family serine protease
MPLDRVVPAPELGHIVRFKSTVTDPQTAARGLASKHGLRLMNVFGHATRGFSTRIPEAALFRLLNEADIEGIYPDIRVTGFAQYTPWGLKRVGCPLSSAAPGKRTAVDADVFVLDTGVALNNADLNLVESVSYVPGESNDDLNGHGTMVAGVICAKDNQAGVVGVAPGARLHSCKVLDKTASGPMSQVLAGLDRVVQFKTANPTACVVANLSLGGFVGTTTYNILDTAIADAVTTHGITVVVAAGNDAVDAALVTPAHTDEALTVGSYGMSNAFSTFSNFGAAVDVLAPGEKVLTTYGKSSTASADGTSFSAPHVAGAVALYLSKNRTATPLDAATFIKALAANTYAGRNPRISACPLGTTDCSLYVDDL